MARLVPGAVAVIALATLGASAPPGSGVIVLSVDDLLAICATVADGAAGCGVRVDDPNVVVLPTAAPPAPRPVALATAGRPGCVTGPGRPVVGTTTPTLSVTFAAVAGAPPSFPVTFEYQLFGDPESVQSGGAGGVPGVPVLHESSPGEFGPGETYRWRARATPPEAQEHGWSDWCEFTMAAGLPDFRDVANLEEVQELGLVPKRSYTVGLSGRQWRTVLGAVDEWEETGAVVDSGDLTESEAEAGRAAREITDAVRRQVGTPAASGRRITVTLTGDQWPGFTSELAGWAFIRDETALESDPGTVPDGSALRSVVDLISRRLGGPAHPFR